MPGSLPYLMPNGGFIPSPTGGGGGNGATTAFLTHAIQTISGGTTNATGPGVSFANSNNVSFGINGNTITASVVPDAGIGLAVPGSTVATGTVVLSNSNGITFGMAGSTVTAQYAPLFVQGSGTNVESVGPTSTLSFDWAPDGFNGRGVRFIAAPVGGKVRIQGFFTALGIAAGTQTVSDGTTANAYVMFSNSNNVTFGLNGSTVTASASVSQSTAPGAISAGTTSASSGTIVFSNSNSFSFGMNGNTITASFSTTPQVAFGVSAGTQSVSTGTLVFSNSNGITFGMSGSSRITASYTQSTAPAAMSAGTTSASSGTIVFSNSNNVSFGMNGNTITATITTPAETPFGVSAGTQSVSTGTLVFSNSNNVSFGMSGSSRVTASANSMAAAAGTQTATGGTVVFSNSNGVTFGMSNSSVVTASYTQSTAPAALSAGTTSASSGTIVLSNSNNVSFGMNGNTITASASAAPQVVSMFDVRTAGTRDVLGGSFFWVRTQIPFQLSATRLEMFVSANGGTNFTYIFGVYTLNASTASLASSGTTSGSSITGAGFQITHAIGTWNLTPGEYLFAMYQTAAGGNLMKPLGNQVGTAGAAQSAYWDVGVSNATTLLASINLNSQNSSNVVGAPYLRLVGTF